MSRQLQVIPLNLATQGEEAGGGGDIEHAFDMRLNFLDIKFISCIPFIESSNVRTVDMENWTFHSQKSSHSGIESRKQRLCKKLSDMRLPFPFGSQLRSIVRDPHEKC